MIFIYSIISSWIPGDSFIHKGGAGIKDQVLGQGGACNSGPNGPNDLSIGLVKFMQPL